MKTIDYFLQDWRIRLALKQIKSKVDLLDIGCGDGILFRKLGSQVGQGYGIDPKLAQPIHQDHYKLVKGYFPKDIAEPITFDVITALAIVEHIPSDQQAEFANACYQFLRPGGILIITTPDPFVDRILDLLKGMHLIDGMSLEEHYGFEPRETPQIFLKAGFQIKLNQKFQLGLNNLFVFVKGEN